MKNEPLRGEEEREITEREVRAYQAGRGRKPSARPDLNRAETRKFLRLVSEMANSVDFEIRMGMKLGDVEHYKKQLNVEDPREARTELQRMELEDAHNRDEAIEQNRQHAREAEAAAQARLDEYERKQEEIRAARAQKPDLDSVTIAEEDSERQRRWTIQQEESGPKTSWRLPGADTRDRDDILRRFKHELQQQGWSFCTTKYQCSVSDLKSEARRLKIKMNWDIVPR